MHIDFVGERTPTCFSQAKTNKSWTKAMIDEYKALLGASTWILVKREDIMNVTGCKWVFNLKQNFNDSINKCKTRLVVKGYNQRGH